jgi:mono/diheme cytochrome c family protein
MKRFKHTVLLAGVVIRFGLGASLAGAEPRPPINAAPANSAPDASGHGSSPPATHARPTKEEPVTYLHDVWPIFMGKCVRCHNSEAKLMYNWLDYKTAYGDRWEIRKRVWDSWKGSYYKQPMPAGYGPELLNMTEEERFTIKRWVETGAPYGVAAAETGEKSKAERAELGKRLFTTICAACHQPSGYGIPGQFPPLARSDFLNADKQRAIGVVLKGLQGKVTVNGRTFDNTMPSFPLSDDDIANALTFVYNSFGNSGKEVTPQEVKALRADSGRLADRGVTTHVKAHREPSPWE